MREQKDLANDPCSNDILSIQLDLFRPDDYLHDSLLLVQHSALFLRWFSFVQQLSSPVFLDVSTHSSKLERANVK